MKRHYRYEYWTVDIPSDCESDPEARLDLAILQVRDIATYRSPANWHAVWDNGEQIRIARKSRKA